MEAEEIKSKARDAAAAVLTIGESMTQTEYVDYLSEVIDELDGYMEAAEEELEAEQGAD